MEYILQALGITFLVFVTTFAIWSYIYTLMTINVIKDNTEDIKQITNDVKELQKALDQRRHMEQT